MGFLEITGAVALGGTAATVVGNFIFGAIILSQAKRKQKRQLEDLAAQLKAATKEGGMLSVDQIKR